MRQLARSIDSRIKVVAAQRSEKADQGRGFVSIQGVPISRHVTSALHHLPDKLVIGHMGGNGIEGRAAQSAGAANRVAVAALLILKDDRTLTFERRPIVQVTGRNHVGRPRIHDRAPGCIGAEPREDSQAHRDHHKRQHRDRAA